ncbi:ligand-binding sensor domain-containing protein [Marinirhabdus gelatinilytica]|uniref:Two component regulator with propeller domain n=1 Tax=Marinirhabdus gelatinilytica TaxID=1703343 RepID=A0A370QF46_9FLAO|nr:sensor histidine kinase [Marinirhabdus gelatinilytica]RDK86994.1 two component regulator with propeller domain [Marinirhabdus gelatinilytica]
MRVLKPIFLILFFLSEIISAQSTYEFQHFGVDDGLSQVSVYAIAEDEQGHIWFATHKGLNRFDGSHFTLFESPLDTINNGLVHNEVGHTIEDSEGFIWITTRKGLSKYDPRTLYFTNFTRAGICENCLLRQHTVFLKEVGEHIYIGTNSGLSRIHKKTHRIISWPYGEGKEKGPMKTAIREIELLDDGRLAIISNVGISLFNPKNESFSHITMAQGLPENKLQSIYRDRKGNYWIGCETMGLLRLIGSWDNPSFAHYPPVPQEGPSHGFIYEITEDKNGILWLATFNGITLFDTKQETFRYIHHDPNRRGSISSNQVFDIHRDKHERMWVATISGVNLYDPYLNQFQLLDNLKENGKGLSSNKTFSVFEDSKGYLWVGNYENGLTVIPPKDTDVPNLFITQGEGPKKLSGPQVLSITEDGKGRLWLATFNGINIIDWPDRSTNGYSISKLDLSSVSNNPHLSQYTYFVKKGDDGTMYVGTHGAGLIKIGPEGNLKQYSWESKPKGILENVILSMEIDDKGRLWLGTSIMGFAMIENPEEQDSFKRLPGNAVVSSEGIHSILTKEKDKLLMATGVGIFQFEDKEELFSTQAPKYAQFTEEDGLSDNVIYDVVQTDGLQYWISTGSGLTRWNSKSNTLTPFTKTLANKSMDFNLGATHFTKDSTLYVGSTSGLVSFKPSNVYSNPVPPNVYFSEVRILNEAVPIGRTKSNGQKFTLPRALPFMDKIILQPKHKIFSVHLGSVNHTLPSLTEFAYKLDGFDKEWTYTQNPIITRSNLDPDTYTLFAKAANNDGIWGNTTTLQIEILPPWYRTWWAYILFALLVAGAIYVLLKLRLQQERRVELARAQERDMFRKRSSRDFHDEAGTKITRISLITELARLENTENKELQQHLSQIEENLQDLNSGMRDFIWTLDPTKDNAYDTLIRYTEFAGSFCEMANVKFQSEEISEDLKRKEFNMAERRHLLMILKEATNNCIKHGNPTIIHFRTSHKPGKLILKLKDNGKGFNTANQTNGNGLNNMQERTNALGGALKIASKTNGGTTLTLTLETTRLGN